jgi:hypothetical protein
MNDNGGEFVCTDCGKLMIAFRFVGPLTHCTTCDWLRAHISDPAEQAELRYRLGVEQQRPSPS